MTAAVDERIEAAASRFCVRERVPAVGAAVIDREGRLHLAVVGRRRRDRPERVVVGDQWHIGSCTKAVTAALYALLVQRGDTGWDRPVSELFADSGTDIDRAWATVTIDDVLRCRAGIGPNPTPDQMKAAWADARPLADQRRAAAIDILRHPPVEPGRFVYSNLGYILVGAAIDRITGASYEEALRELILEPLQLASAGFGPPPAVWGHGARSRFGGLVTRPGRPVPPDQPASDNPSFFNSAGRLHLSLADWATLQRRLWLDAHDGLLTAESLDRLLRLPEGEGMAMGWAGAAKFDGASYGMQGSNTYWAATALLDQGRHRAVMVVTNDGRMSVLTGTAELASEILRVAA